MTKILNPPQHANAFEHTEKIQSFLFMTITFGFAGILLGRFIDKQLQKIDATHPIFDTFLQLLINAMLLYFAFKVIKLSNLSFDDWSSSTFRGIVFLTMFFSVQDNLYTNARKIF
jgi:hydrogenase-4 membrane subunit HyfE